MSDLINRQDALDILYDFAGCIVDTPGGIYNKAYREYRNKLESLPSADNTGEWHIREYEYFTCSECGEDYWNGCDCTQEAKERLQNGDYPNFCPNCGADMRKNKAE